MELKFYMDQIYESFINPGSQYRGKPFWAWNGELEEEELLRQIHVLKQMGFGGFFMHSRTGLKTEYLGQKWFDLVTSCTEEAEKLGLEAWIYDEDRWPSGCAGGIVTKDTRYARKYLSLTISDVPVIQENTVAVFRGKVEGLVISAGYEQIDPAEVISTDLSDGEKFLSFCHHVMKPQNVYNGFADLDRLNLDATKAFIRTTHEQYKKKCGDSFVKIKGIFTDEPHRGMVFSDFSDPGEERNWSVPWTDDLPEEFAKTYGYDLISRLPELFLRYTGAPMAKIKWQYMALLQQLFMDRFLLPIQKWCEENDLLLTGHLLNEDSLMSQVIPCGSLMQGYGCMDIPGIDSLTDNRYVPWAVKALESAARQNGQHWKLTELYGATGWHMSFADYKYVGDWQAILGANLRCPHLSWYTMEGEAKRDYPGTFLHQATWYQEYSRLETYFARLGVITTLGTPVCDTLVLHPAESLWCQIQPEWADVLDGTLPWIQKLEKRFQQLFHWMMETHVDFDYGDEGVLANKATVEVQSGIPCLRVGKMLYRRILISGCTSVRNSTKKLLEQFSSLGGEVVFVGPEPGYVEGEYDPYFKEHLSSCIRLRFSRKALLDYFAAIPQLITIANKSGGENIYLQTRKTEEGYFVLLWNRERKANCSVTLQIEKDWQVERWDCFSGERNRLIPEDGKLHITFSPGEEHILFLTKDSVQVCERQFLFTRQVLEDVPVDYELNEPNVCVLDVGDLWVNDRRLAVQKDTLDLDRSLRKYLGMIQRSGEMVQPWAAAKGKENTFPIALKYKVYFEAIPSKPVYLAMEALQNLHVRINGKEDVLVESSLYWIDRCFHVYQIQDGVLQQGENVIEVTADYSSTSGLENLYLLGDFGVYFRNGKVTVGKAPKKLRIGNLVRQGLPFYGGKVKYYFDLPVRDGENLQIRLPKMDGSCAIVHYGGQEQIVPWESRSTFWENKNLDQFVVELVLHRRNTFGPLHLFPVKQPYTAPDSFVCMDTQKYSLYPTGLRKLPEVYYA